MIHEPLKTMTDDDINFIDRFGSHPPVPSKSLDLPIYWDVRHRLQPNIVEEVWIYQILQERQCIESPAHQE